MFTEMLGAVMDRLVTIALFIIAMSLLCVVDWRIALGVYLLVWANNIERTTR